MPIQHETELYDPIKRYFLDQGYDVKGEVLHCDLVASAPHVESMIVVELKKSFSLTLLMQALQRQQLSPVVYVAFEHVAQKKSSPHRRISDIVELCRRLQLGVLTVTFYKRKPAEVIEWASPGDLPSLRRRPKRTAALKKEFELRSGDFNVGGSQRKKLITVYREKCLRIAHVLHEHLSLKASTVAQLSGVNDAARLMQSNYEGWFERVERGVYRLTEIGVKASTQYAKSDSVMYNTIIDKP